jgi:hypothetical protein
MWRVFPVILAGALVVALAGAACEQTGQPVPVTMPVASPTVTETFSGTLAAQGSNLHNFQITKNGEIDVTLTTVTTVPVQADPNAVPPVDAVPAVPVTYPVTIRVGQPTITTLGVTCSSLKAVVASAGAAPQLTGQALTGTFCVSISDPNGTLPQSIAYVVVVAHS